MKTGKRLFCTLLVVLMLITSIPMVNLAGVDLGITAEAATYQVGDLVSFGSYPQNKVTDSATITALNNKAPAWANWTSYGYYSGTASVGSMVQGDWMRYTDIMYNGNKYRAVKFTQYRPYYTYYPSSNNAYQDDNGYSTNTVYWFKFEPIDWRVLDPATGLVMCETIIDSQPYSNTIYSNGSGRYNYFNDSSYTNYASDYETSSIRKWLNNDFYNTAFTDSEKKEINTTTLNNDGYHTSVGTTGYEKLDSNSTNDKIFLLSYNEVRNSNYGFNSSSSAYDPARFAQGSDYAQSQGLYVHRSSGNTYNGNSLWRLRSPGDYSYYCCYGSIQGNSGYDYIVGYTHLGVRPALRFNRISGISQSQNLKSDKVNIEKNDVIIQPLSNKIEDLFTGGVTGVKFTMGSTQKTNTADDVNFTISDAQQAEEVILSKADYRDYIIPQYVISSWKTATVEKTMKKSSPAYEHTAVLEADKKDGKPYVSTVFARETYGTYQNVRSSSLNVSANKTYDIILSACGIGSKGCTYVIEQDVNHQISNKTGIFLEEDLFEVLEYGLPCYAYVKLSDGTYSDLVEIKLNRNATSLGEKTEAFFKGSSLNLLGNDFLKFKVPSDIPLVGDAEISLNAFKLPAGVEIDGNSVKISVGANIFEAKSELKKNSYNEYKKWSKSCFSDWKDVVDGTTVGKAYENTKKNHRSAKDEYDKARDNFIKKIWDKEPPSMKNKSKSFDISALGYIDASVVNGQLIVNEALISIEGSFAFKYTQQGAIWVIPDYVYAEMGASLGGSALGSRAVPDNEVPFQWDFTVKFEPELTVGAGGGVKDFASLGIWAKATSPVTFNFSLNHLKWDVTGSIGIEAQFIILKGTKELFSGTKTLVDKYWGTVSRMSRVVTSFGETVATTSVGTATSVADRDYLENTTEWLGEVTPYSLRQLAEDGLTLKTLQGSVYDQASPRVVSFGDKMLMTWVEDDASRDTYNRMRLMYSIYNGSTWSEPVAVYDDGNNDNAPVIATDGEDVYFAWQKINKTITEANCNMETLTANCEIFTAKYDSTLGRVVDIKQATDNNCYDYAHNVSVVGDEIVYYWATCNDNQMNISSDNDIYRLSVDGTAEKVASDLNYILSIDAAEVDGKENISYSMDSDGDTTTANDINVYTVENGSVTAFDKGDNDVAYSVAFYGELEGEETLFVSDMTDIYYMQNGELKNILAEYTAIGGNINYLNKNGTPYLLWTQNEAVGNAVYSSAYENGEWTTPVKVSNTETQLSSVDVAIYNNEFMGVCTSTDLEYNEDDESYELGQVNLCSFKIAEVQDISLDGIYIDENNIVIGEETKFDVYVTNYGTTNIENIKFNIKDELGFESTVEKEVNLLSGEGKFVELTYISPENYGKTTLSVTVVCDEIVDSNSDNDTAVAVIGIPDIVLTESELIELDGSYILNAMVTNESDVSASNVVINTKFNDSEDVVDTITIDTIKARETHLVEYILTEDDLVFDEETNIAKVYISVDTEDRDITANKICFIIEQSETTEEESDCSHTTLELIDSLDPTCTEPGYTGAKKCVDCGEVIEATTEIPANDHTLGDWYTVTPAKCEVAGEKKRDCSVCDYSETQEIPATGHNFDGSKCKNCDYDKANSCSCNCHAGGIKGFFFKFILFFQKIFKKNRVCEGCGIYHY